MEKKKNSVNLTEKKTNNGKNTEIKRQVQKEDQDNKKIIIAALLLALVLGILVYWQVSKKSENNDPKDDNKTDIVEKDDDKDDTKDSEPVYHYNGSSTVNTTVQQTVAPVETVEEEKDEIFYSLSFDTNGGKEIEKQVLAEDQKTESILPEREGWSFAGWFIDKDFNEEFIFGRVLSEDTTLYAKWVKFLVFKTEDGEELGERQSVLNEEANLLTKEDLGDLIGEEYEVAWMMKTVDEEGKEVLVELMPGTVLDDETVSKENETVELFLRKLEKFEIELYLSESDQEPFDTVEAVEERTVDFSETDKKLKEMDYTEYAWFYRDSSNVKWTFFRDQKATKDITKLYLDEAYTVIYKDEFKEENNEETTEPKEDETTPEVDETTPVENENEPVVDEPTDEGTIVKEDLVAKDSHIKNENIPVPEEREGYEFLGWFLVADDSSEIQLTEDMVIDGDKVFIARWKKIEEVVPTEPTENDSVEPEEEEQLENTEEPTPEQPSEENLEGEGQE